MWETAVREVHFNQAFAQGAFAHFGKGYRKRDGCGAPKAQKHSEIQKEPWRGVSGFPSVKG